MKTAIIVMLSISAVLAFAMILGIVVMMSNQPGADGGSGAGGGTGGAGAGSASMVEDAKARVLQDYEIAFWGEGRPFVKNARDRLTGELLPTTSLVSHLMFDAEQSASGFVDEGGFGMKQGDAGAAESAYRMGLICEHGLYGAPRSSFDAVRYYRMGASTGHAECKAALQRLGK